MRDNLKSSALDLRGGHPGFEEVLALVDGEGERFPIGPRDEDRVEALRDKMRGKGSNDGAIQFVFASKRGMGGSDEQTLSNLPGEGSCGHDLVEAGGRNG